MCGIEKGHIYTCLGLVFAASIFSILICWCIDITIKSYNNNNNQTKENNKVDSIITINKTFIIELEQLDSIKNEKIIKVKELDNDSTIKLFYKLIQ